MAETHPPMPTLAFTQEAINSAQADNIAHIGHHPGQYREALAIAGRYQTPPAAIVFGGIQKGIDRTHSYDPNQPYYVALGAEGPNRLDEPLPRFEPTDEQLAGLVACRIPERWTTADLSELIMTNMYRHPSIAKTVLGWIASLTTAGAAAGMGATKPLQSNGHEVTYEYMAVAGVTLGLVLSAGGLLIHAAARSGRFGKAKQIARELRPFPVWGVDNRARLG